MRESTCVAGVAGQTYGLPLPNYLARFYMNSSICQVRVQGDRSVTMNDGNQVCAGPVAVDATILGPADGTRPRRRHGCSDLHHKIVAMIPKIPMSMT